MASRQIQRLPGMRDVKSNGYAHIEQTKATLELHFGKRGYLMVDTPLLEESELFVRKSGGELTGRLYTFTDPGGHKVSLRPEFTSSMIRHFIQECEQLTIPLFLQYSGPVFRYEPGNDKGYHQFTQVGVEQVGSEGVESDAAILSLAWSGLQKIGLNGCQIRVGHLEVLRRILSTYELSEPAKLFMMSNIQALKSGRTHMNELKQRAIEMGLLRTNVGGRVGRTLRDPGAEVTEGFIESVLEESIPSTVGQRTTEEIAARLLRRANDANNPKAFDDSLALLSQLSHLDGAPDKVLKQARGAIRKQGIQTDPFDRLERLLSLLGKQGVPDSQVVLDLGLARGIGYYTGVIFELTHPRSPKGVSLGGGGRYDGLVRALGGGKDVPALGFAYNLDQVVDAMRPFEASTT